MRNEKSKLSGILFLFAGGTFIVASITGREWAFVGVAVVFIAIGVDYLVSARGA